MLAMQTGLYAPRVPYVDAIVRRIRISILSILNRFPSNFAAATPRNRTVKKRG